MVPCSGIGKTYGTVSREAAYEVSEDLRPATTRLVALSLLVLGDEEARAAVQAHPAVTIDGCKLACAAKMVQESGGHVAQGIAVLDVYRQEQGAEAAGHRGAERGRTPARPCGGRGDRRRRRRPLSPTQEGTDTMPDLPERKVGIIACSGEELAEGTVTRLAALGCCRSFGAARRSPSACPSSWRAEKGTGPSPASTRPSRSMAATSAARHAPPSSTRASPPPASWSAIWSARLGSARPEGARRLNQAAGRPSCHRRPPRRSGRPGAGQWNRRSGSFAEGAPAATADPEPQAGCACGSASP